MEQTLFFVEMIALSLLLFKIIFNKKYYLQTGSFWFYLFFALTYGAYRYFYTYAPADKFLTLIKDFLCVGAFTYLEKFYYKETSNTKQKSAYKNLRRRNRIVTSFSLCSTAVLVIFALMICLYPILETTHILAASAITFMWLDMIVFGCNSTKDRKPFYILFTFLEALQQVILAATFKFCWPTVIVVPIILTIKILQIAIILYNVFLVREVIYE